MKYLISAQRAHPAPKGQLRNIYAQSWVMDLPPFCSPPVTQTPNLYFLGFFFDRDRAIYHLLSLTVLQIFF